MTGPLDLWRLERADTQPDGLGYWNAWLFGPKNRLDGIIIPLPKSQHLQNPQAGRMNPLRDDSTKKNRVLKYLRLLMATRAFVVKNNHGYSSCLYGNRCRSPDHAFAADLRRVVPATVKRVASEDSPRTLPGTDDRAIFLDRLNEVVAARRLETTVFPQERTDPELIKSNATDQKQTGKLQYDSESVHRSAFGSNDARSRRRFSR